MWEVERLLNECKELPQYLLMENVPQVICTKNINDFKNWCQFLTELGYTNSYKLLNAKDYGIPQNRKRCFMISILNGKKFKFPEREQLKLKLKDILEYDVDEKYYLPSRYITNKLEVLNNNNIIANLNYTTFNSANIVYSIDGVSPTLRAVETQYDYLKSTKIGYIQNNKLVVRLLTPKEHLRLMGVRDNEINKFSVNSNQQIKQAGNSIVVNVLIAIFKNLFINKKYENTLF